MATSQIKPITKAELYQALKAQTKELTAYADQQTEKLAGIVNTAFQEQKDHFDQRFDVVEESFGVVETKLDRALYTELTQLEARVVRLEQRIQPTQAKAQKL